MLGDGPAEEDDHLVERVLVGGALLAMIEDVAWAVGGSSAWGGCALRSTTALIISVDSLRSFDEL